MNQMEKNRLNKKLQIGEEESIRLKNKSKG